MTDARQESPLEMRLALLVSTLEKAVDELRTIIAEEKSSPEPDVEKAGA